MREMDLLGFSEAAIGELLWEIWRVRRKGRLKILFYTKTLGLWDLRPSGYIPFHFITFMS